MEKREQLPMPYGYRHSAPLWGASIKATSFGRGFLLLGLLSGLLSIPERKTWKRLIVTGKENEFDFG